MRAATVLSLLLMAFAGGCGVAKSPPESRAAIDTYFEAIKQGSVKHALHAFSPEFFAGSSPEEVVTLVDRAHAKLGPLKAYTVTTPNVTRFTGTSNSGIYTTFECEVEFEKYKAVESFRVFQPIGSSTASIVWHSISSPGFAAE